MEIVIKPHFPTPQTREVHDTKRIKTRHHQPEAEERLAPLVCKLASWIAESPSRTADFDEAIRTATSHGLEELEGFHGLDDYLVYLTAFLRWTPSETVDGTAIYHRCCYIYFILNQPSVVGYQNLVYPGSSIEESTWLSQWMVDFGREFGAYMDTPESINEESMASFRRADKFLIDDYIQPKGGWRTFNEFFSRKVKPERRPIAGFGDDSVWISPVDCTYVESFPVSMDATITVKTLEWSIAELLDGSKYASTFANGLAIHGFLNIFDYHRFHSPVKGKVLEARRIQGRHYSVCEVIEVEPATRSGSVNLVDTTAAPVKVLEKIKIIDATNEVGYEFAQTRGVYIIETEKYGLIAIIAVGMGPCASVTVTVDEEDVLEKGQEMGYFRFGGSDCILLVEKQPELSLKAGQHVFMGQEFGKWTS